MCSEETRGHSRKLGTSGSVLRGSTLVEKSTKKEGLEGRKIRILSKEGRYHGFLVGGVSTGSRGHGWGKGIPSLSAPGNQARQRAEDLHAGATEPLHCLPPNLRVQKTADQLRHGLALVSFLKNYYSHSKCANCNRPQTKADPVSVRRLALQDFIITTPAATAEFLPIPHLRNRYKRPSKAHAPAPRPPDSDYSEHVGLWFAKMKGNLLPHSPDRERPETIPFLARYSALKTVGSLPPTARSPASLRHPPARARALRSPRTGAHARGTVGCGLAAGKGPSLSGRSYCSCWCRWRPSSASPPPLETGSSLSPSVGAIPMTVHNLYLFDRNGVCLHYSEWHRKKQAGIPKEEEYKLMYGMLFSIRSFVSKMSPLDMKDGFLSFQTSRYKLHYYETPTGIKVVMNTDLGVGPIRDVLHHIYSALYVELVVKNPLCPLGQTVQSELFRSRLDSYVRSLPFFSARAG